MSFTTSAEKMRQNDGGVGGLCHLVEAATALSKLVEGREEVKKIQQLEASATQIAAPANASANISDDDEDACKKAGMRCNSKREIFPQRLQAILSDSSLTDIVSWLPQGHAFVIMRPDVFTEQVLPKYLPPVDARGSTKYPSFTRKLNRWGFRQITRGPDTGAFHHPFFRRDQPELCLQMVCQRSRDRRSNSNSSSTSSSAQNMAPRALPPKKRTLTPTVELAPCQPRITTEAPPDRAPCAVSCDDNSSTSGSTASVASSAGVARVMLLSVPAPPATICAKPQVTPVYEPSATASLVSKDETLVQDALRQSLENERLRTAKAMLYHAYMQALGGR